MGREVGALAQDLAHVAVGEAPGDGARIPPVVQYLAHLRGGGRGGVVDVCVCVSVLCVVVV